MVSDYTVSPYAAGRLEATIRKMERSADKSLSTDGATVEYLDENLRMAASSVRSIAEADETGPYVSGWLESEADTLEGHLEDTYDDAGVAVRVQSRRLAESAGRIQRLIDGGE